MDITPTTHTDPSLMVELEITNLPVGTAYIQAIDGLTHARITTRDITGTSGLIQDFTAPAGEALYLIRAYDNTGTQLDQGSITVTTPEPPQSHVWISDPLDETSAMLVPLTTAGDRARPRHAHIETAHTIGGRTIASIGPTIRGEWQIVIHATNPTMIRALAAFIDTASSILIRAGTEMFLPSRLYGAIPESSEHLRLTHHEPDGFIQLTVAPADAPGIEPIISTWTWDALEAFCEAHDITWDTLGDEFPTWIDVERGPVGAGD